MSREIRYLEDKDIVVLRTSGTYKLEEEVDTLKKMALKLKEHDCNKSLFDHRKTHVIARTMSSYERPSIYEELWGDRSAQAAIVFREITEEYRFLETVCRNQVWYVRIFKDYDKAIAWLTG